MKKELFEHYTWIFRGKQRKAIIVALNEAKTPTQLKEATGIKVTNVSDVLREMTSKGLTVCLNPNDKLGRFYELTKIGKELRKEFL